MATLREIRKRLQTVHNIKQITSAMEMVAAARLRYADPKAQHSKLFNKKFESILEHLALAATDASHLLLENRKSVKKTGLIVVAADGGHCGAYNSTLMHVADRFLKKYNLQNIELILFGRKAVAHFNRTKWPVKLKKTEWGGKITLDEIKNMASQFTQWFSTSEMDEIWIIYTHFISVMRKEVRTEKFIPFTKGKSEKMHAIPDYIIEPPAEDIYKEILPLYFTTKLHTVLDDAYAAELAARVFSMRTATKNAEELIESLTLYRNKVRQASITKEMLEITSGSQGIV